MAGRFQFLYGEGGDDTYVYGTASGSVYIGSRAETATSGTADRVIFSDLNVGEVTLSSVDYRSSYASEGVALVLHWSNAGGSGQLQIANGD